MGWLWGEVLISGLEVFVVGLACPVDRSTDLPFSIVK